MPVNVPFELQLINLVEIFALASVIWAVATPGIPSLIRLFGIQSFFLALGSFLISRVTGMHHILYAAAFTFTFKVILIPLVLTQVFRRLKVKTEIEDHINVPASLLLCSFLVIIAHTATLRIVQVRGIFNAHGVLAVAISIMLIGFYIMVNRKRTLTQVIGLMFIENGVFLAAVAMTYGMPILIEFGIFFDVFVGLLIMGIMLFKIKDTLSDIYTKEEA